MKKRILLIISTLLFLLHVQALAQNYYMLRGYVYSENNEPLAGVSVRVFQLGTGTTTDEQGRYELRLPDGLNRITYTYLAHKSQTIDVVLGKDEVKNVWLKADEKLLSEVEVRLKKKDFSYEVIQHVIDTKDKLLNQYQNYACKTYIKAIEETEKLAKKKTKTDEEKIAETNASLVEKPTNDSLGNYTLFECSLNRFEALPNDKKEERTAVKKYGNQQTIFFKSITDGEFNLYENLQKIAKLGDNQLVSPFNSTLAFLTYKFKLIESYYEGEQKIYRIKVSPREVSNAAYEGELEVYDNLWVLKSAKLKLPERALIMYDEFEFAYRYEQIYEKWVLTKATYSWKTKEGGSKKFGKTEVVQSGFEFDKTYPKRFFSAELGSTTAEAYKRDTTYWASIRPEPLTLQEQAIISYKDSLTARMNSKEYLDSLDKAFNKITPLKVLWGGVGHINRVQKTNWTLYPMVAIIDPLAIGGWRVQYGGSFSKRFENRQLISANTNLKYGFLNRDIKGSFSTYYLYNPKRVSSIQLAGGHDFGVINGAATFADVLRRSNFYQQWFGTFQHRTELFNGLYVSSVLKYQKRYDLGNFKFAQNSLFENNLPATFPTSYTYQTNFDISYTPKQLYLSEPNEKVVLGSRFPTFSASIDQAWGGSAANRAKFTYLSFSAQQTFDIGIFGTSQYRVSTGKFLDTTRLSVMDYRYIRGGDRYFFFPAMAGFQAIERTFPVFDWFVEGHYVHQFNGFFTSKVPLLNKTGIKEMAGAGFLYAPERSYQYSELFFGLNRVFRLGRDHVRLGVYNVLSQSNRAGFQNQIKFSIELYNRNKNTWSF